MLEILSHRGLWKTQSEKNTLQAFQRSFEAGFGIETDVRDYSEELVISHDMAIASAVRLQELVNMPGALQHTLALNIKADGLASMLQNILSNLTPQQWFVFDMSVPDMKEYMLRGMPVYARMSEVEPCISLVEQCVGVWLDAFNSIWYSGDDIATIIRMGKKICVVSEELHGRSFKQQWEMLRMYSKCSGIMLCTDKPEQARTYFGAAHD